MVSCPPAVTGLLLVVAGLLVVVVVTLGRKSLETKLMAPSLPNERKKWTYNMGIICQKDKDEKCELPDCVIKL